MVFTRNPINLAVGCWVELLTPVGYEKVFCVEKIDRSDGGPLGLSSSAIVTLRRLDEWGQPIPGGETQEVRVTYGVKCDLNIIALVDVIEASDLD
jgi:hypothetical protein